jgi:hypothetical protein
MVQNSEHNPKPKRKKNARIRRVMNTFRCFELFITPKI